jgi:hypothetical protein
VYVDGSGAGAVVVVVGEFVVLGENEFLVFISH